MLYGGATLVGRAAEVQNMMEGRTCGAEAWGPFQAASAWRLSGGLRFYRDYFQLKPDSGNTDAATDAGNDSSYTWMLRSLLNLTSQHDFDIMVRHVAALPDPVVPAYTAVDARLAWRPAQDFELAMIGWRIGLRGRWTF